MGWLLSVSRSGYYYDNAPAKSWFASLKVECIDGVKYRSQTEAHSCLFDYIEVFYNRQRLHSYLGYLSPLAFKQQYHRMPNVAKYLSTKTGLVQLGQTL